jgi:hypothetical protein
MLTVSQPTKFYKICKQTIFFLPEMKIHSFFSLPDDFLLFAFYIFFSCHSVFCYKNDLKRAVAPVYTWG